MNPRRMKSAAMALLLGVPLGCAAVREVAKQSNDPMLQQMARNSEETEQRTQALQKDCDALKARTISFDEEYAFGGAVSVNWVSQGGGVTQRKNANALNIQLNKIGRNLAAQSSRPNLPWTFGVLQSDGVNAVSGPGGFVFVSEGLLTRLDNEAQLAGVLAHEISHITGKHALRAYKEYLEDQCDSAVNAERLKGGLKQVGTAVSGLSGALGAGELRTLFNQLATQTNFNFDALSEKAIQTITDGVVTQLSKKGFAQEDEYSADLEAVDLMASAGYAPEEYIAFLGKLPDKGLSTEHPRKDKRQARLREHLDSLRKGSNKDDFISSVDLSRTKAVPLRGEFLVRPVGTAARGQ